MGVRPDSTAAALADQLAWIRRLARELRRGESRRADRRRPAARPELAPSRYELAERVALHRRLAEAVLELNEPYQAAILPRFFEALPPR